MHNECGVRSSEFGVEKAKIFAVASLFLIWGLTFNVLVIAEDKEFKKGCRTCHAEQIDKWDTSEIRHFPYREEKCESCHAAEHKKFTAELGKPCLICHELNSEKIKQAHFSADLAMVNCFGCHYTHASDKKGLFKESVHEPFVSGMCDTCHNINTEGKIEVDGQPKKICLVCHSTMVGKDDIVRHSGYEMLSCVDCHNPHTSSQKWLLKKSVSDICFDCHGKEEAAKHPYDVAPSQKINLDKIDKMWLTYSRQISCVSCHNPHVAKIPFLLREPVEDGTLCYICHLKSE